MIFETSIKFGILIDYFKLIKLQIWTTIQYVSYIIPNAITMTKQPY